MNNNPSASSSIPRSPGTGSPSKDYNKKTSPNPAFLSSLKSFNIERSRYKHYGHQSSMNAQSLDRIINEVSPTPKSPTPGEPKPSTDADKTIIDDTLKAILGIDSKNEMSWPYTTETLTELIKFKTQQEKTRQEEVKNEFATTALQLLTLAKSMNINSELIPYLFLNSNSINDLQSNIDNLKHPEREKGKRRHSDTKSAPPSAPQPGSALVSPMRSPPKSPVSIHRRGRSDDSESARLSNDHSPASQAANTSYASFSQEHSPNQVVPPQGMYPVYYPPPPQGSEGKTLGSPYQQKYQHVVYSNQPYPMVPQQYYYMNNQYPGQPGMAPPTSYPNHSDGKDDEHSPYKKHKSGSKGSNNNINFMISTPKNPPARKYNNPHKDK